MHTTTITTPTLRRRKPLHLLQLQLIPLQRRRPPLPRIQILANPLLTRRALPTHLHIRIPLQIRIIIRALLLAHKSTVERRHRSNDHGNVGFRDVPDHDEVDVLRGGSLGAVDCAEDVESDDQATDREDAGEAELLEELHV